MSKMEYVSDMELKTSFLEDMKGEFSDAITHVAKSLLLTKIQKVEEELGKEFYNFSPSEVETMLREFRAKSVGSLNTYWSILCKYLVYANDRRDNVDITMTKMLSSKQMESFVNKVADNDRYITREELQHLLLNAINPQDQAIFILLFEGVCGKGYTDIVNLKKDDVDLKKGCVMLENKSITIKDRRTLFILDEAIKQNFYFVKSKTDSEYEYEMTEQALNVESKYILRKIDKNKVHDCTTPISTSALKGKITVIAKELGRAHLTGKTIYNSGLAERFMEHFGYNTNTSNVSTEEIKTFLEENQENISPANLRSIVRNIQEKLGVEA